MSDPYNPGSPFRLTSGYGKRTDPITGEQGEFHSGQDYRAPPGTPIPAATPGEVVYSGYNDSFGHTVIVRNAAGYSLYAHMQEGSPMPQPGQRVWPGDIVGNVGSTGTRTTGPHLHYSVIKNDWERRALGEKKSRGGPIGLRLTGDDKDGPGNTIDPARFDTGVPYLLQAAVTAANASAVPSAPLNGLGSPGRDLFAGRFGAWTSLPDNPAGGPAAVAPRPGGLPGMIADYLRRSQGGAGNSQAPNGPGSGPAVPFVPTNDPLSPPQPVSLDDRFDDWSKIRRLSSLRNVSQ